MASKPKQPKKVRIPIPEGESWDPKWFQGELILHEGDCYRIIDIELDSPPPGWPPGPNAVIAVREVSR